MYHPRFNGDHYQFGLKYGKRIRRNNVKLFGFFDLDEFQTTYGNESERILRDHFPEACNEIRGIADGLQVPYKNFAAWLMCISVCYEIPGCTMLARIKNDEVVFGRNNDLPPVFLKISSSALYAPLKGHRFIANSSAFVSAEEGINEKGLAVGMTYVWAKELKPGFNSMFFVRFILEKCASAEEGLKAIQSIPIGGAYHLILADRNSIIHAECSPEEINIRRGTFAIASNHFISKSMSQYEETKNLYHSRERYQTAYDQLRHEYDVEPVTHMKNLLSGHYGFMCQYKKQENFDTVWSTVFDLSHQRIFRAEGNPARNQYRADTRLKIIPG